MKKIYDWFHALPKQIQDSFYFALAVVGFISTLFTVLGISLNDLFEGSLWLRILLLLVLIFVLSAGCYIFLGKVYKDEIVLNISQTPFEISYGDIFKTPGMKLIGCDTHFDTRIDDIIITKNSLHGQLFLKNGNIDEIRRVVEKEALRLGLQKNQDGLYEFPIGTVIRYDSSVDGQTYLMLAMNKLNQQHEAHTNMAKYELMLMKMWKEINRVYASHDVNLPILGTGILRFDDGPKNKEALLRCMLCTFNSCGIKFHAKIRIVIYGNEKNLPLYEYKNVFSTISRK